MESNPYVVRIANRADISSMAVLINAAFSIETFLEGSRTREAELAAMMEKGSFLLAYGEAGRMVASVYLEIRGTRGYFGMLAVDPAQQGKGLARVMVRSAEDFCRERGCSFMDLTVLSLRPELPALYRKLGYIESGTEEFRPSRPLKKGLECHCIVMSKPL